MKPREYQADCVDAIFEALINSDDNPVAASPTGTGKSIIIGEFNKQALMRWPSIRILVLSHVKELVEQDYLKQLAIWPQAPAGVYSAGLKRKDVGRQITFAGIGSIKSAVKLFKPDIVFVDECQSVSHNEETTYRKVHSYFHSIDPTVRWVGLSATPYRIGQGMIVEPGGIFTRICIDLTTKDSFNWFIDEGYLVPLIPRPVKTEMNISEVDIAPTGDFNLTQLQKAVDKESITRAAVDEIIQYGEERNHWLIFAAGVQHANHIAQYLAEKGIAVAVVHSNTKDFPMSDAERDANIEAFTSGKVRAIVNNGVLTTGFDFPGIDLIACMRHTTSPGLWVQMLGRGTRPLWRSGDDLSTKESRLALIAISKPNCLVLDFAHNAARLGPVNDPIKPKSKKKSETPGDAPSKTCPACWAANWASARICAQCGEEFKFLTKIDMHSSSAELIAKSQEPLKEEWFKVSNVTYSIFKAWNGKKKGHRVPESLRVGYVCGLRTFFEHVNLEHEGNFLAAARQWWTETSSGLTIPQTALEAESLAHTLKQPKWVKVWINRPNPKILYREFTDDNPSDT